jgi:hypothetical protein
MQHVKPNTNPKITCQHNPTKEEIKNYNNALSLMFCGGS